MGNKGSRPEETFDVIKHLETDAFGCHAENSIQLKEPTAATKVTLKRTRKRSATAENAYPSSGKQGCVALIINNESKARGAAIDAKSLRNLFKALRGEQQVKCNLERKAMMKALEAFARQPSLSNCNVFVMVVLAPAQIHGDKIVAIEAQDKQSVAIAEILALFSDSSCPPLAGKPKLFIFQGRQADASVDADLLPCDVSKLNLKDVFIANALLTGRMEEREIGSYYVQALCKVFELFADSKDLEKLIKTVDEIVYKNDRSCQHTYYEMYGFNKLCYFNLL